MRKKAPDCNCASRSGNPLPLSPQNAMLGGARADGLSSPLRSVPRCQHCAWGWKGLLFFRTGRYCLRARALHSAASHTARVVRRNLLSPQWAVALTRQTSQDFARAIRIDLARQKTLASVASSRHIRPRGRLAARPNCVFSPSLRRRSSQIAHPGQLRVLWPQPKVCLDSFSWAI